MKVAPFLAVACVLLAATESTAQSNATERTGGVHMRTILEKTFLKIDVLSLDLCLDRDAAARIAGFLAQRNGNPADDSVTQVAIDAHDALGRIRFLRDVRYDQFLDGIVEEQRNAVKAGLLDDSTHGAVRASLPEWFSFLENRDIKEGDEVVYDITGDTIRTTYVDADGVVLMERIDTGPSRRRSVLVTWVARGSGFRKGLLASLRRPVAEGDACREEPGEAPREPPGLAPGADPAANRVRLRPAPVP